MRRYTRVFFFCVCDNNMFLVFFWFFYTKKSINNNSPCSIHAYKTRMLPKKAAKRHKPNTVVLRAEDISLVRDVLHKDVVHGTTCNRIPLQSTLHPRRFLPAVFACYLPPPPTPTPPHYSSVF